MCRLTHSQGENWNVLMYDCWRATSWLAPIYFLSLVILGAFVIMNVFLAILLSNFDSDLPVCLNHIECPVMLLCFNSECLYQPTAVNP